MEPMPHFYRYLMAFIFAIDEINKNPDILPNVTLGYHVYDSCNSVNNAVYSVLQILSGPGDPIPNYFCKKFGNLVGIIGDLNPDISLTLAQILGVLGYSQISYGTMDPILSNSNLFPLFFQALPNYSTHCLAIIQLLRHYNWTWIGVITSDDDFGEKQSQELKIKAAKYEICVEYIIKIYDDIEVLVDHYKKIKIINKSTSQVIVICGTFSGFIVFFIEEELKACEKTFIIPAGWIAHFIPSTNVRSPFHGSLVFSPPIKKMPGLKKFLQEISPRNRPDDIILETMIAYAFQCFTSGQMRKYLINLSLQECNRTIKLGELGNSIYDTDRFRVTYLVYKSVYTMAHALHEMQSQIAKNIKSKENQRLLQKAPRKRLAYEGAQATLLQIKIIFKDKEVVGQGIAQQLEDQLTNRTVQVGGPQEEANSIQALDITIASIQTLNINSDEESIGVHKDAIDPHQGVCHVTDVPVSTCSEQCPPSFKRILKPGSHKCCFLCMKCSEGEIYNETDRASCQKCPEDQWPNDINQCVPKSIEFLSYKIDPAVLVISVISVLCFLKTSVILGIFILFRDTPVVQANNKTMSFILLFSTMLSFLCVFLFLGRPTHVTCMLRQTSFGIIFSVAVSSILAKTIMVYMAFKATKPGTSWRRLIGVKISNCVVFVCSFIQALLSIIWLSTSPPFPEMNTHLYQDKIIFQCNEGSMLAFSMLLGYIGLLAAISFIVAFLARNLPDSFNEAKNITFSMLVVCSVWVAFIPSYMSVTGKNTVLVEIFAVISSSFGILSCIFLPKCYIILVRPELNSKFNLSSQIKANTKGLFQCKQEIKNLPQKLNWDMENKIGNQLKTTSKRLTPLSQVITESGYEYKFKSGSTISHLLYMDDIKLYVKNE
ncbi:vomeronasal type-2 receptor 26-like [Ranitomeya imitator]|uniref:vomeronasal type-2 receptor 26-like n=1 Tax=Ranitomeya imitator TaxID=111125 RepID=UPI0037E87E6C